MCNLNHRLESAIADDVKIRYVVTNIYVDAIAHSDSFILVRKTDWRIAVSQVRSALFNWEYSSL